MLKAIRNAINSNPKLLIVFCAFAYVYLVESVFNGSEYYLFSSIAFAMISMVSSLTAYRLKSKVLFCYATVNLFAAIINWFMSFPVGYDLLSHFYWYATLNFSLVFLVVELMIILDSGRDAFNFIHNQPNFNHSQRSRFSGVVEGF